MYWAVSQGTHMRRVHIKGDLNLFVGRLGERRIPADCLVDGTVDAGSQQQWFARNSRWKAWKAGNGILSWWARRIRRRDTWPQRPYTVIPKTPVIREKPFLVVDEKDHWFVMVPELEREIRHQLGSPALREGSPGGAGTLVPIDQFYLAQPEKDTAASLNRRDARERISCSRRAFTSWTKASWCPGRTRSFSAWAFPVSSPPRASRR